MDNLALVTAGDTGIGLAVSIHLARQGFSIGVCSRKPARAEAVVSQLRDRGHGAMWLEIDVTDESAIRRATDSLDSISVLVNAAGVHSYRSLDDLTTEEFRRSLEVNVVGTFAMSRAAAAKMTSGGRVITIGSRSMLGGRDVAHYASSKAAIVGLTRSLASELLPRGITVNAVCPSLVETPMTIAGLGPDRLRDAASGSPRGRLVTTDEVAAAVAFLASAGASGVTGQCLIVDGGADLL